MILHFRKRAQIDIKGVGSGFQWKYNTSMWFFKRPLEGVAETQATLLKKINALIEAQFEPQTKLAKEKRKASP